MRSRKLLLAGALLGVVFTVPGRSTATDASPDPSPADYAAAAKLLTPNLQGLVRNESVAAALDWRLRAVLVQARRARRSGIRSRDGQRRKDCRL